MFKAEDTSMYSGVIYGLHNGDYDFRYIGKTTMLLRVRFNKHLNDALRGSDFAVHRWIRKNGIDDIQICIIETFSEDDIHLIDEREVFHIDQQRQYGVKKNLNMTAGGEGARGYRHTPEAIAKIKAAKKGWTHSPETRAKLSAAHTGRKASPETRAKISAAQVGRTFSEEHKAKLSLANTGQTRTDEARAKMSESARLRAPISEETRAKMRATSSVTNSTPEYRAKMSTVMTGKVRTAEHQAKLTASAKGRDTSKAVHTRWHINRGIVKEGCEYCVTSVT